MHTGSYTINKGKKYMHYCDDDDDDDDDDNHVIKIIES
jgi:hypothetical protein